MKVMVWMKLIIHVEKSSLSTLSKKINCSYTYLRKVIQKLEKEGFIQRKKEGRIVKNMLTEKGREVQQHVKRTLELLGENMLEK